MSLTVGVLIGALAGVLIALQGHERRLRVLELRTATLAEQHEVHRRAQKSHD